MEVGEQSAITDVPDVSVGHMTLIAGSGKLVPGHGPVRTGVTVILPHSENVYEKKLRAGVHVQNGAGELTGALQVMEWGILETQTMRSTRTLESYVNNWLTTLMNNLSKGAWRSVRPLLRMVV